LNKGEGGVFYGDSFSKNDLRKGGKDGILKIEFPTVTPLLHFD